MTTQIDVYDDIIARIAWDTALEYAMHIRPVDGLYPFWHLIDESEKEIVRDVVRACRRLSDTRQNVAISILIMAVSDRLAAEDRHDD